MSHELTQRIFAAVDTMKPDALTELITEDARLVFGNTDPLVGRDAITTGLQAFYSTIKGLRHRIINQWYVGADTVVETEVTYHRLDDRTVCLPVVSIWHAREDALIDDYRVFFDLTGLHALNP